MPKIGRNAPCPCGSGKKYKKCCMGKGEIAEKLPNMAERSGSFPEIMAVPLSPSLSPEESALYNAFDEIVELERTDRVREAARKFLKATANVEEFPDDFGWDVDEIGFNIAMELRRDDPDQCIRILRRTILFNPLDATITQRTIAEIMVEKGDVQKGFSLMHRLIEENPHDIWCCITLGRNYVDIREYGKAEEYLQRAMEVGEAQMADEHIPEDIGTVYIHLFDVYRETGRIEDAIQAWREAASRDDLYLQHANGVCDMLIEEGDLERTYQFAEEIQYSLERNYYLGKIRSMQGDEEAAIDHWNTALAVANYDHPQRWAEIALRLGKHELVTQKLPSLIERFPKSMYCRALLSLAHVVASDMESAQRVLESAPERLELWDELRQLCTELPLDEQNRVQWLEMFSSERPI